MAAIGAVEKITDEDAKEAVAKKLVISEFIFVTAVAMVVPARAPLVLAIKNGDTAATAKVMGLMSSLAAFIELFMNPLFGQLADMYGRKPFFGIAAMINAVLHASVGVFPKTLPINFVDRMISGAMIFAFKAPLSAALGDLYQGPKLAMWLARQNACFGLGLGLGPFIGSKLGGARAFLWSAVMFLVATIFTQGVTSETLPSNERKSFNINACSPLRFLKLFQGKMLSTLSLTVGLQSFGDYFNIYDINYLYLKTVFDVGQTEIGQYASCVGVTQFLCGPFMSNAIAKLGQKPATLLANVMWASAMGLLGTARSVQQIVLSLGTMTFGHLRNSAVSAYIQKHGQALGMGRSEIAAAQANFLAVLKVGIPFVYGNIFAMATSGGRNMPGAPYVLISILTMLSQLTLWTIDPDQDK